MRVLITGGGTAGHINPALAIAAKIRQEQPDAEILFVGAEGRMETRLVPAAGYDLVTMQVQGFQRKITLRNIGRNIKAAWLAATAGSASARILREFAPDVAIGTGGYVCGPVLRKAAQMGIPVFVHESNAFPGMTVKMLARYATVLLADKQAEKYLPEGTRVIVTGNPLRPGFSAVDRNTARRELGLDDRPFVLSFGGSLGAKRINETMLGVLARSAAQGKLQHMHATGQNGYDGFCQAMAARSIASDSITVRAYIDDMPRCMAAADAVICRCGAMTLSELPVLGKPAILIPSPNVAENHQYHNAMALVRRGAAVCIEEKDLTEETLWQTICDLTDDPDRLREMAQASAAAAVPDAADRIYAAVTEALK